MARFPGNETRTRRNRTDRPARPKRKALLALGGLAAAAAVLFSLSGPPAGRSVRAAGPGQNGPAQAGQPVADNGALATPVSLVHSGKLPGVTWADDVHQVFVRNGCARCHARGGEAVVNGQEEFSLGLVDPADPGNGFWSYHELVYAEGRPTIQDGEQVRDGQSAWPLGFSTDQRRRVWLGRPERSVLMRALDRDYYDWNSPPRNPDEAFRLAWGSPMPSFAPLAEGAKPGARFSVARPSAPTRLLQRTAAWFGLGRIVSQPLMPEIPARDRALVRHWIANTGQLSEPAQIKVSVMDLLGTPAAGATVVLVGDLNGPDRREVTERIELACDRDIPAGSVVSSQWYVSAETKDLNAGYRAFTLKPGSRHDFKIVVLTRSEDDEQPVGNEPVDEDE
jgi:hypothetical protein